MFFKRGLDLRDHLFVMLAAKAQVSISTVSRIINNSDCPASDELRKSVEVLCGRYELGVGVFHLPFNIIGRKCVAIL